MHLLAAQCVLYVKPLDSSTVGTFSKLKNTAVSSQCVNNAHWQHKRKKKVVLWIIFGTEVGEEAAFTTSIHQSRQQSSEHLSLRNDKQQLFISEKHKGSSLHPFIGTQDWESAQRHISHLNMFILFRVNNIFQSEVQTNCCASSSNTQRPESLYHCHCLGSVKTGWFDAGLVL